MKKKILFIILMILIILAIIIIPIVISTYTKKNTEPRVIKDSNGNLIIIGPGEGMSDEEYRNLALQEKEQILSEDKNKSQAKEMDTYTNEEILLEEDEATENEEKEALQKQQELMNILYKYNDRDLVDEIHQDVIVVNFNSLVSRDNLPAEYLREYELVIDTYEKNELSDDEKGIVKEYLEKILNSIESSGNNNLKNRIENIIK